jgi:hypothetical protein
MRKLLKKQGSLSASKLCPVLDRPCRPPRDGCRTACSPQEPRLPHETKPMQCRKDAHLRRADRPTDYKRFGVAPVEVAEFEDGQQIGVERAAVNVGTSALISTMAPPTSTIFIRYRITATIEEILVDIKVTGIARVWRPESGHLRLGAQGQEKQFTFRSAVPQGSASVRSRTDNGERRASGSEHNDHNWGDVPIQSSRRRPPPLARSRSRDSRGTPRL